MSAKKKCNENNKKYKENPDNYECNTDTGRWVKKIKEVKVNTDDDKYVIHPKTGKRYTKTGKMGREILDKMNETKFLDMDTIPQEILNLSDKTSMKEIRDIIKKYNLNLKSKVKSELIENIRKIFKRRENKKHSLLDNEDEHYEKILVEKPKKKSLENVPSSSKQSSSEQTTDSFFKEKDKDKSNTPKQSKEDISKSKSSSKNKDLYNILSILKPSSSSSVSSSSTSLKKSKQSQASAFVPSSKESSSSKEKFTKKPKKSLCNCDLNIFKDEDWDIVNVPSDHHCGFHCIWIGLKSKMKTHPLLDLKDSPKNLILELRYLLIKHYKEKDDDHWMTIASDPQYWMEDKDIKVFADYFNICFCIYDRASDNVRKKHNVKDVRVFTSVTPETEDECSVCIYLYQHGIHYDLMFPKNDKHFNVSIPDDVSITEDDLEDYLVDKNFVISESSFDEDHEETQSRPLSSGQMEPESSLQKSSSSIQQSSIKQQLTSQEQQEIEIASNTHLKVISDIKKLQMKEFVKHSQLTDKEMKKIIKGTLNPKNWPDWLK